MWIHEWPCERRLPRVGRRDRRTQESGIVVAVFVRIWSGQLVQVYWLLERLGHHFVQCLRFTIATYCSVEGDTVLTLKRRLAMEFAVAALLLAAIGTCRWIANQHSRAWYNERAQLAARLRESKSDLERLGAKVYVPSDRPCDGRVDLSRWHGSNQDLAVLAPLSVDVRKWNFGSFPFVGWLNVELTGPQFGDKALPYFVAIPNLRSINLADTDVTDEGLRVLESKADGLQSLELSRTKVTDAGLAHLGVLTRLRSLVLVDCANVSEGGVAKLQELLPNCVIVARPQSPQGGGLSP
jgi:hypothetical protein